MKVKLFVTLLVAVLMPLTSSQAALQDLAALRDQLQEFAQQTVTSTPETRTEIDVGGLDPRLRLRHCETPLQLKLHNRSKTGHRLSVNVSCQSGTRWSIYIPVSIKQFGKILSAKHVIRKGSKVASKDLVWEERQLDRLPGGYFTRLKDVVGMDVKRHIRSGMVIAPKHLRPPYAVRKGENVIIKAAIGGVEVKMNGEALGNGVTGDIINVTNRTSRKTIQAEVIRPGVVQVRL